MEASATSRGDGKEHRRVGKVVEWLEVEEELGMGLLGHEVQAGMDAGDADEAKASGEEAPGGGAARSWTRASMASGPC